MAAPDSQHSTPPLGKAPGPRGLPLVGVALAFRKDPLGFLLASQRAHGDVVCLRLGTQRLYFLHHPDLVRRAFQDQRERFSKAGGLNEILRPVLGDGLLNCVPEDLWRRNRQLMQPAFRREALTRYVDGMVVETARLIERWQGRLQEAGPDWPIPMAEEMSRLTLHIVLSALFTQDLDEQDIELVSRSVTLAQVHINHRLVSPLSLPERIPTPRNRRYLAAIRRLEQVIARLVKARRAQDDAPADLLSHLLTMRGQDGSPILTDTEVRDEIMTFMLAGHETTANALAWLFYLLSRRPQVVERMRAEIDGVLGDRAPTAADLHALAYTQRVLMEAMRLYPPVWLITRTTTEALSLQGIRIPAGAVVAVSPYVVHRHPDFWDQPEDFDPDRFADKGAAKRHPFAYLAFGGGPRKCIGNHFALIEGTIAAAMVCRRFDLQLAPGARVSPDSQVTLRPGGLTMHARARADARR